MMKRAMAKRKGYWLTTLAMYSLKKAMLPLKKVSPIHAIPKIATMAFIPAPKTLPLMASPTFAFPTRRIKAATDIIMISMISGMDTLCISPSSMKLGRMLGILP